MPQRPRAASALLEPVEQEDPVAEPGERVRARLVEQVGLAGGECLEQLRGVHERHQLAQQGQPDQGRGEDEHERVDAVADEHLPHALEHGQHDREVRQQQQPAAGDRAGRARSGARGLAGGERDQQEAEQPADVERRCRSRTCPCTAPSR